MPTPRQFRLVIGRQRSGKSHLLDLLGRAYAKAGRWACAYNLGMATDFAHAEPVGFLPIEATAEFVRERRGDAAAKVIERKRQNLLWRDGPRLGGSVYAMRDWNARVAGRFVKAARLTGRDERGLLQSVFDYWGSAGLLIWDDARVSFRQGLSPEATQLFTRINHAGELSAWPESRGYGIDVALVFHAVSQVNPELLDAATHLTLLSNTRAPDVRRLNNPDGEAAILKAHGTLETAKPYSRVDVDLKNPAGVVSTLFDARGRQLKTWTQ